MPFPLYPLIRGLLFRCNAETVHEVTLRALRLAAATSPGRGLLRRLFDVAGKHGAVTAFGRSFRNPLGVAAGYDKDARAIEGLACLGFGHVEVGTVTLEPQQGHPRPRLFRLAEDQALVNRLGFPNRGSQAALRELRRLPPLPDCRVGVSIG